MELLEEHINENIVKVKSKIAANSFLIQSLYRSAHDTTARLWGFLRDPYYLSCCVLIVMEIWRPGRWVNSVPRMMHEM